MKPRLYLKWHVWSCVGRCGDFLLLGFGYTPREAYADWKTQAQSRSGAVILEIGA